MKNRCLTYVLPIINDTLQVNRSLLVNGYLRTKTFFNPKYIFLTFKPNAEYETYLKNHDQVEELTHRDNVVVVKFRLNSAQHEINLLYLKGAYSQFPKFVKDKILKFYNLPSTSKHYQILYKLPILKHKIEQQLQLKLNDAAELGTKTNIIEETLQ